MVEEKMRMKGQYQGGLRHALGAKLDAERQHGNATLHNNIDSVIVRKEVTNGMEALEKRLADYLEGITGERPDLRPIERGQSLPLFLRERYALRSLSLFGRKCVLALEGPDWESGSPAEYASQATLLHEALGEVVAIVIPKIPSYARNRMVHSGVPFIVPGSQMFLPSLMVDLRERFSRRPRSAAGKRLAPAAQCILLYHLLRKSVAGVPLRNIAEEVGYSPMNLTRAKDELEAAGLCESGREGRAVVLDFPEKGPDLWEQALPVLSSPVRHVHWVQWDQVGYPALRSGLTALSRRTMIEDDRIPTYALPHENYRLNLEKGLFHGCPGPSEANLRLEAWSYNPLLMLRSPDEECVDPLSLFLSLQDSADERVQQQLETLIEEVQWA